MQDMRLFKRGETYYVEYRRGDKQSLKTTDAKEAARLYKAIKKEWLEGKLIRLESEGSITLRAFADAYLKSRKGMAQKTQDHDALSLDLLCDVLKPTTPLKLLTTKKMDEFKSQCLKRKLKPTSVNSYLRHIKSALSTAEEWGHIQTKPKVRLLKTGQSLPTYLRPEEIELILLHASRCRPEFHRLLVAYLWTGARRNELLGLQWQDCYLDVEHPYARLTGKGNKERVVPLLPPVLTVLEPHRRDVGPVFVQANESTVTHWYKAITRDCEIESHLHELRHTAATYMLASGIPLTVVQEIMGHADLATTSIYSHVVKEHLHREMGKLKFE